MDFLIGYVTSAHGIKGELKVFPVTDDAERFSALDRIFLQIGANDEKISYAIENVRYHKQNVILKLKGIDNMTDAERVKKAKIYIEPSKALPLSKDEYYIRDLYDMEVFTADGTHLGRITDILSTAANDVYTIEKEDRPKPLLIPAIKECILDINVQEKKMTVKLLEGLLDL